MTPYFIGFTRIKNEARWIERVIAAQLPLVDHLIVLDDHSTDNTRDIVRSMGPKVELHESPFQGLDERRDKQWLLDKAYRHMPQSAQDEYTHGCPWSPYWAVCFDGDEELVQDDIPLIREATSREGVHAVSLKILYLWDSPNRVRVDRVYRDFRRPSIFRLMNQGFMYQSTPFGKPVEVDGQMVQANFHCSSIPQELLHNAQRPESRCEARLLHWGYIDRDLRMRKHAWYNRIDPNNHAEDCYNHCIQGDVPEFPPSAVLRHAGPMEFVSI
jgi:glycosyltransferase involved in cell wall biosynthesis